MITKADIQFVRSLADKQARTTHNLFVAEGEKLVGEIQNSNLKIRNIYTTRRDIAGERVEYIEKKDMDSGAVPEIDLYNIGKELGNKFKAYMDACRKEGVKVG